MRVTGDDEVSLGFHGAVIEHIISWIVCNPLYLMRLGSKRESFPLRWGQNGTITLELLGLKAMFDVT